MSTHKHFDKICCVVLAITVIISILFVNAEYFGVQSQQSELGYESRLFDTSRVHTIDIVIDDWDAFISTAQSEEYSVCSVVIDGEAFKNVGIRGKGNTSLSTVASMNSDRYSFKIEFDQYDSTKNYYGLDKLSLNNLIQDNTMMKDYLTYQLMREFGVASPLCSYVYVTVNGEDWGLYLAVEAVEESFMQRNYGSDYGELYKPDSMDMGGGRGNGKDIDMSAFLNSSEESNSTEATLPSMSGRGDFANRQQGGAIPGGNMGGFGISVDEETLREAFDELGIDSSLLDGIDLDNVTMETIQTVLAALDEETTQKLTEKIMNNEISFDMGENGGMGGMGNGSGSGETKLQYTDDDPSSYSAIFGNAKTDVTAADQTRLISALKDLNEGNTSAVDTEAVIRYFVVHNFVVNGDSYTGSMVHNYYLYEEQGKLSMIPWDYNLAFGTFQGNNADSAVNDDIDSPLSVTGNDRPMIDWIFDSEEYTELYHQYFEEFLSTVDAISIIEQAKELIAPYVEKDPTKFCTYEEFEQGVEALVDFCELRTESVTAQLNGEDGTVDASSLNLSDMGTMSMGGGKFQQMDDGNIPESGENDNAQFPAIPESGEEGAAQIPQMPNRQEAVQGTGQFENNFTEENADESQQPQGYLPSKPESGENDNAQFPAMPGSGEDGDAQFSAIPENGGGRGGTDFSDEGMFSENTGQLQQVGSTFFVYYLMLFGASVLILVLGIVFALLFKRRKGFRKR